MDRIRALVEAGQSAEVRTARGAWRSVVAIYSDATVGTVRAGIARQIGRFTVLEADHIVAVRSTQQALARPSEERSDSTEASVMEASNLPANLRTPRKPLEQAKIPFRER